MGATTKEHLEEKQMGVFHSHNAMCGCMFAGNEIDGVRYVFLHETSKSGVQKEKSVVLVKMIQVIKVMHKKDDNKTLNVLRATEKEEMFKSGQM